MGGGLVFGEGGKIWGEGDFMVLFGMCCRATLQCGFTEGFFFSDFAAKKAFAVPLIVGQVGVEAYGVGGDGGVVGFVLKVG